MAWNKCPKQQEVIERVLHRTSPQGLGFIKDKQLFFFFFATSPLCQAAQMIESKPERLASLLLNTAFPGCRPRFAFSPEYSTSALQQGCRRFTRGQNVASCFHTSMHKNLHSPIPAHVKVLLALDNSCTGKYLLFLLINETLLSN